MVLTKKNKVLTLPDFMTYYKVTIKQCNISEKNRQRDLWIMK